MAIFEDEIVNNKAFERANLIFTEPWVLTNEIMLNIMQNFKFDFLKNEFWVDWGVRFKFKSAKLRALRAKNVLACQRALRAYVLMCQRALRADVLTWQRALRAHVPTCLACLRAHVTTCLSCLCAHVPTCLRALV